MNDFIRKYESAQAIHRHDDFHQIIVPLLGTLELDVAGHQGQVSLRTIGAISVGENHAFCANGDNRFLVLDIPANTTHHWDHIWTKAVEKPFLPMSHALCSLSDYALYHKKLSKSETGLHMWQNLFLQTLACDLDGSTTDLPHRIQKALNYIEANFARPLQNRDIANHVCLSPSRFHDLFVRSLAITPQQYLLKYRLQHAKRLITQGHRLAEIAQDVGFSDQSSFGRAFTKEFGTSPAKWRKQEFETKTS